MLKAVVDEDKTPEQIAELAQGSLRKKQPEIAAAIRGQRLTEMPKELIGSSMRLMAFLELEMGALDGLMSRLLESSRQREMRTR